MALAFTTPERRTTEGLRLSGYRANAFDPPRSGTPRCFVLASHTLARNQAESDSSVHGHFFNRKYFVPGPIVVATGLAVPEALAVQPFGFATLVFSCNE